ncbi:Tat pathway signal protein [Xanthomonas fragariae]|uniref:Tat pathway signal protein n=1 Tax=Xanthomonas fragariae TaxID=48664 RepID=UPI000D560EED|nr:Tat pathway signal protein [Xanthomonas fragariae]MDM7555958.1 Tat pathway signal protein [Xanthomonas fragariae]MDM7559013.1 Tat pathway signal protein [Xanthomonas fragariae]MDM7576694.1 Tat pathway signal protein [Xanthomonas fragariae]MDM7579789.1 Tat pathway signal protein [Xanthomonas fragariae]MDM7589985.1 Tat pathway signal protein [Xanthomonas fragariae]
MDRRTFLHQGMAAAAAVGTGAAMAASATATLANTPPAPVLPRLEPLPAAAHAGSKLCSFRHLQQDWTVYEHLDHPQGQLTLWTDSGMLRLDKRTEPAYPAESKPYFGMPLAEVAMAEADLLADRLLRDGDPDEAQVRDVAPPPASLLDPKDNGGRWPWTTFVGTREGLDTMPILPNGRSRTSRPEHAFAELGEEALIKRREEGMLGGWMPAVRKVMRREGHADTWYDVLVFADVRANDRFVVQTWHRTMQVRGGEIVAVHYTHSYPAFAPSRTAATAEQFYAALIDFTAYWQQALDGTVQAQLPDASWNDMAQFAFARELVVRPGGHYPKYGAVERDYYGNEYDGFQDTFTSSFYANLEWGRFAQAAAVLDNYFDAFVQDDGLPNMRGPEVGQCGLTLSLLARYLRYTGDAVRLRRLLPKIAATAQVLCELHDQALALPRSAHGHGLLHGWNESDACLFPDPSLWWKPYYANSALAIRGWEDIAQVWSTLGGAAGLATDWHRRAKQLRAGLQTSLRANVRRDLSPPYVGPLPGTKLTFRQSLQQEKPSEQQWPHRAYAELLQADVLPDELANLVIDCLRGHGGTSLGVVANIGPPEPGSRDLLGFISYGYAQQLLRLDRIEEYLLFVYAHRYQVHTRGSWTAGEVSGITGGMPLFCIPAQMTIPLLLRWMLVSDDSAGEQLYLARAVPRAWLGSGAAVGISAAPTRWGNVTLTLCTDRDARRIDADVQLPEQVPKRTWLTLRTPAGTRLDRVLIDGRPTRPQGPHADRVALPGRAAVVRVQAWYV